MWKKLQDTPPFYFQLLQKSDIQLFVTDYISVFSINIGENDFLSTLKKCNPALEISNNELLDKGLNMILNMDNLKSLSITKQDTTLTVSISKSYGYPLKLTITLEEASKEVFFYKVTQPLLKIIKDLQESEHELRKSLKEKDAEIEKYKEEGSKIRKHWKTKSFNEEEHVKKHEVYQDNFIVCNNLPSTLLEAKEVSNEQQLKQETENINVKQEPTIPTVEQPISSDVVPKIEIKQEVKSESQSTTDVRIKKRKKLNL